MALSVVTGLALMGAALSAEGQTSAASALAWPQVTQSARPWTRWWWPGNAVDKENLSRLLATYAKAGLGGVEITCIYGVKGQEAHDIPYLSPEWVAMLKHTAAEAHRLGMGVDLPPGSGWRIGGPQIPEELASANLDIHTQEAVGGKPLHLQFGAARPQAVVAFAEGHAPVSLLEKIAANGELAWTPEAGIWTVYTVGQKYSGSKVKRPSPGGEGRAFNAFSQSSLDAAMKPFDALFAQLPYDAIRAQFHDSFEYEGNWTEELFAEFQVRCRYDLRQYLPALLGKGEADEVARVKSDYRFVMGELLLDNVIAPWVAKAHSHRQLARNQAHGSPGNLLDLYAAVDIPETEVFGADRAPLMAQFASSPAHVMGKPLVSSETGTWLAEHFTERLAEMKAEADMLFLSGINHIFYHGTAYSPADAPWPGWLFYASTEMNPNNPIWHDVPALNAYITRCQSLLQLGRPDNDVLLYWPVRDVWQDDPKPMLRQLTVHKREWFEDQPFGRSAQRLRERGYAFDYVSDRQLARAQSETPPLLKEKGLGGEVSPPSPQGEGGRGGEVQMPGGNYRAVVVPPCRLMPMETLQQLAHLAEQGATVIFEGDFPQDVPGWGDLAASRAAFHTLIASLKSRPEGNAKGAVQVFRYGKGRLLIGSDLPALLNQAGIRHEPLTDVPGLQFLRRADANMPFYFLCNQGTQPIAQWVPLALPASAVALLDPMTGHTGMGAIRHGWQGRSEVYLALKPGETLFLRTLADVPKNAAAWAYWRPAGKALELHGTWQVDFLEGGPELPAAFQTEKPASWTTAGGEAVQRFAGTARYTLTFDAPAGAAQSWLDLGKVCQCARVRLNGKPLGTRFAPPFRILAEGLKPKGNHLEIEVTGVAANRIRDLDRRGVPWKIFRDINFVDINYRPFDASQWPLTDCGLLGPVTLQPVIRHKP